MPNRGGYGGGEPVPQPRRVIVERLPSVIGVQQLVGLVEVEYADRQWIGLGVLVSSWCARPEHAVAHERLVEQRGQEIAGKVCICAFECGEVAIGKKVEHKEVVTLADDFGGNAAGLLCDEESTKVILATLLDPGNKRAVVAASDAPLPEIRHAELDQPFVHVPAWGASVLRVYPIRRCGGATELLLSALDDDNRPGSG